MSSRVTLEGKARPSGVINPHRLPISTPITHAALHHVSRVRTAHAIVSGRRAPSTVRVPDRRDAGGPPDQHGRKDLPGPRGPAGGCLLRQTAPTYNPGPPRTRPLTIR